MQVNDAYLEMNAQTSRLHHSALEHYTWWNQIFHFLWQVAKAAIQCVEMEDLQCSHWGSVGPDFPRFWYCCCNKLLNEHATIAPSTRWFPRRILLLNGFMFRFHVETLGVACSFPVSMMMFLSLHTTFAVAKAALKCRNICEPYLKMIWRNVWRTETDWNG